jgi:hypothetical protein
MNSSPLDEVENFIRRFLVLSREEHYWIMTLWIGHTYFTNCLSTTPRLAFLSPEFGCGKSRAMEVLESLSFKAGKYDYATRSALFRFITETKENSGKPPTLLLDELDTVFRAKNDDSSEALRQICNSGYRTGAKALITEGEGKNRRPTAFSLFASMALAGKGDIIPESVKTRGIQIRIQKKLPNQKVEDFHTRAVKEKSEELCEWIQNWSDFGEKKFETENVELVGTDGRVREVWLPLYAVARLAGEEWEDKFHSALALMSVIQQEAEEPLERLLLEDCLKVIGQSETIRSESLVTALIELPEKDYGSLRYGKGIDNRWLSKRLSLYDIRPKQIRFGEATYKGYHAIEIRNALERYSSSITNPEISETSETSETSQGLW